MKYIIGLIIQNFESKRHSYNALYYAWVINSVIAAGRLVFRGSTTSTCLKIIIVQSDL